jgi:hypothetical protein
MTSAEGHQVWKGFPLEGNYFRYSSFVPRLANFCTSLGFEPGMIMPSRAFCSDENQGYPIIVMTQHFGTFPFDHGRVGGVVALGRHGPHAHHGKDLVIVQASHVGYTPSTGAFGKYCRTQCVDNAISTSCGKIAGAIQWYLGEYKDAQNSIFLEQDDTGCPIITIDLQYLELDRKEGIFLDLKYLLASPTPQSGSSVSRSFLASAALQAHVREILRSWPSERRAIGSLLAAPMFHFKREVELCEDNENLLERNLMISMPYVVTARWPMLLAAEISSQAEFYRTYRSILTEPSYSGKNLVFVSGVNIDISPENSEHASFPLTKFVPWAAFVQKSDGTRYTLEQSELVQILRDQNAVNPDQVNLDESICAMEKLPDVRLEVSEEGKSQL